MNLNGKWDASVHAPDTEPVFSDSILVPFPAGSALSGFDHVLQPDEVLTVRTFFENPLSDSSDCLRLHFGAVSFKDAKVEDPGFWGGDTAERS